MPKYPGFTAFTAGVALLLLGPSVTGAQGRERDRISHEELQQSSKERADLFQAIRSLRPHFLQGPRGTRSVGGGSQVATRPIVYLNGTRMGEAAMLRDIPTRHVAEVRFVPPSEASMTYGLDHGGGVILVTLVTKPPGGAPPPQRRPCRDALCRDALCRDALCRDALIGRLYYGGVST